MTITKRALAIAALVITMALPRPAHAEDKNAAEETTFSTVDVVVDTGDATLGAYQLDLRFDDSRVRLVGVESGADLDDIPVYDPRALRGDRVVLAGVRIEEPHPRGRVHVAVLHVEHPVPLTPRLRAADVVVADHEGRRVAATLETPSREENR